MKYKTRGVEWVKRRIILWLDKRYDDACWYNLVLWSLGEQSFKDTFGPEGNWREQDCTNIDDDYAYCGKCVETGRLKV